MPTPERTSIDAIIGAGRAILEESGPAGLTMQAVAVRVGVRAPSLYKRVTDRDALVAAVAESVVTDLAAELEQVEQRSVARDTPTELLSALATAYRAFAHAHREGFALMFTASAPLAALDRAAGPGPALHGRARRRRGRARRCTPGHGVDDRVPADGARRRFPPRRRRRPGVRLRAQSTAAGLAD